MRTFPLHLLLLGACGGQSGENDLGLVRATVEFCSLVGGVGDVVAVACPNVFTAPPGDDADDSLRARPAYEVQAYLAYNWVDSKQAFTESVNACGFETDSFAWVDPADYGVANAEECVALKSCFDTEGIAFPDAWPDTSYFELLVSEDDICGLQSLE